jgi:hypothetical protein
LISLTFFNSYRYPATKKNIVFNITIQQVWNLFIQQGQKCALSGVVLTFDSASGVHDGNTSIDRIDNKRGYTLDNIQLVDKRVNLMKKHMAEERFIELCRKVHEHNRPRAEATPRYLQNNIANRAEQASHLLFEILCLFVEEELLYTTIDWCANKYVTINGRQSL